MIIDQHRATAVVHPAGVALDVRDAAVSLDEARAPYGVATITAVAPADRDALDLRAEDWPKLTVQLGQYFSSTFALAEVAAMAVGGSLAALTAVIGGSLAGISNRLSEPWNGASLPSTRRTLALHVIARTYSDADDTVEVTAATGEAILIGDALVSDVMLSPPSSSLRDVCAWLLTRYDATLEPGTADAVVPETAALDWKPGTTAWDWLNPLLQTASLRLWCDELGVWRLTERESTAPGMLTLDPAGTLTGLNDMMSLNDPRVWADAVVVEYRWTDEDGTRHEVVDAAGAQPARSTLTIRHDTVYPGPGAAAGVLHRIRGRGRVMEATARADYRFTPGQGLTITPAAAPLQVGYVASVDWDVTAARMTVRTRGLVDIPPTAWDFLAEGERWIDSAPGASWIAETV